MTASIHPDTLKNLVLEAMPDAEVHVRCYSGDDHFEMEVVSASFAGKTRIAQHKMVYAALGEHMRAAVHALALKTKAA
ncbi:MAG: BolA family protein [Mariprofundaceae bacterium]